MRVLGVIRLSRETDETTSPERQRAGLEAWAKSLGHTIVGWAEDLDVSGSVSPWERDDLGRWLTTNPPMSFDVIAATKIDRLSRDLGDFVDLIEWTSARGKYLVAYMDSVDTSTPTGELVAKVLAIFAEFERKTIAARSADSQALARQEGRWHGGLPPFGYMPVKQATGEGWKLEPDPEAKQIINQIIDRVLSGESINSICRDFNNTRVLSPRDHFRKQFGKEIKDNKWTSVVVSGILSNKALLGYTMHREKVVRGADGLPVMQSTPVVTRATWEAVQRQLERNSVKKPRSRTTSPLLGVPFCLNCGLPLYRYGSKANGKYDYYRCRGKVWKLGCDNRSVRGDHLTQIIEIQLLSHIGDLEVQEEVFIPGESHREELQEATESLKDLLERSAGKPPAVKAVYDAQIASLEALIERLSALPELPSRTEYRGTGTTYRALWEASDPQARRRLLLDAGIRIEAAPEEGFWVSVGRFERPERYDQAVSLGVHEKIQYAFYVPRDLLEVPSRQSVIV